MATRRRQLAIEDEGRQEKLVEENLRQINRYFLGNMETWFGVVIKTSIVLLVFANASGTKDVNVEKMVSHF